MIGDSMDERNGRHIHCRELIDVPCDQLMRWDVAQPIYITFDDGEVLRTNLRRTILSQFAWKLHRNLKRLPLLSRHHIGNGQYGPAVLHKTFSNILRDAHVAYYGAGPIMRDDPVEDYDRENCWELVYRAINDIWNFIVGDLTAYMRGFDYADILEVNRDPVVRSIRDNCGKTPAAIDSAMKQLSTYLMSKEADHLADNPLIIQYRGGFLKRDQMHLLFMPRGNMTDVDSRVIPKPIMNSFLQGITEFTDFLVESKMAAKALLFQDHPLKTTEYFNRKMLTSTAYVRELWYGDCGTTKYIQVPLARTSANRVSSFFNDAIGKYYLDEDSGTLKALKKSDTHLIDSVVKFRSPMFCATRHDGRICSVCFGEMSYSIPRKTNVGHVAAVVLGGSTSQLVLGVKHHENNINVGELDISKDTARYFEQGRRSTVLRVKPWLRGKTTCIVTRFAPDDHSNNASGLINLMRSSVDIKEMSSQRITQFAQTGISWIDDEGNYVSDTVKLETCGRQASFTQEFLIYIKRVGYSVDGAGNCVISLDEWDFRSDVFELPIRHMNMLDYNKEIEAFIRSTGGGAGSAVRRLVDYSSAEEALIDLADLVSVKLSIPIPYLEVMLLSMMRGVDDDHTNIPHIDEDFRFMTHSDCIRYRSMSAVMAYEDQVKLHLDVDSYEITHRMPHGYDEILDMISSTE